VNTGSQSSSNFTRNEFQKLSPDVCLEVPKKKKKKGEIDPAKADIIS